MEIVVMENNLITTKGKGVLMLCSEDYKAYIEKLKLKDKQRYTNTGGEGFKTCT